MLRTGDVWKQFTVKSPAEGDVPLYVGMDKNGRQVLTERSVKNLRSSLLDAYPAKRWAMQKKEGTITLDWVPIARVKPQEDAHVLVEWNGVQVAAAGVDKDEVIRIFRSIAKTLFASSICWSI